MIYLDASAFIKLYLREKGSTEVHDLVVSQQDPLPVWSLIELEFINALRFKVFLADVAPEEVERLIDLYRDRRRAGQYYAPHLDPVALHELAIQMTGRTADIGSRALDILHVSAARLCAAARFLTADRRQAALAEAEGVDVALIPS